MPTHPAHTTRHTSQMISGDAIEIIRKIIHGVLKYLRGITKTDFDMRDNYSVDFATRSYTVDFTHE